MKILFTLLFAFVCSTSFSHTEDTLFYSKGQEVVFDTIPYMVKDQAFLDGLKELQMMLNGEKPYSLKRAEFIVEWAYSGGKMDYGKFCHDIDSVAYILRRFIEVNDIQQYKTAPNFALFEYFTKPSPMNGNKAFGYDFDDFLAKKTLENYSSPRLWKLIPVNAHLYHYIIRFFAMNLVANPPLLLPRRTCM